jgi:hypothetical protein
MAATQIQQPLIRQLTGTAATDAAARTNIVLTLPLLLFIDTLFLCPRGSEAEFLEEIQTKVFRVFLLAIHSHLYSFALRFIFL